MLTSFLLLLLIWIAYAVWFRQGQEKLLLPPDPRPLVLADAGMADFRTVWVQNADGLSLEGWHRPADGFTKPTVLILNGRRRHPGAHAPLARLLADAGFGVLLAGLRGQAGNPGQGGEAAWMADARTWADHLVGQGISGGRLILYGEETGAYLAATLAAERAVARLILEAPFPSLPDLLSSRFPLLPLRALLRHRFEIKAALAQVQAPVLILHAGADKGVPVALGQRLHALLSPPPRVFRADGVRVEGLLGAGGGEVLLAFLEGGTGMAPPPTLDQEKPTGGRALVVRG
ncbi:MAG: alpha/beta hydrolase [Niveispirillum sp.]|uniref:alpha/beta hydrolase n=1 Tax=Niveispirillum sp. TaxID=1917217 RepID=UPI0040352CAA